MSGSNGGHEFYVKSSSATNIDFEEYFLIAVPGRRGGIVEVPISNPVIGKLELFSIECRKTKTKLITLDNDIRLNQRNEPIRARNMLLAPSAGKRVRPSQSWFCFVSQWLKKWSEFF